MPFDPDPSTALAALERAVDAGRERALEAFRSDLDVRYKADAMDAVTQVDLDVQRTVVDVLEDTPVDVPVVAEEADELDTVPDDGDAWIVDPIDGTNNYARGNRAWTISAALVADGEPVAAITDLPALDDRYLAADGPTRRAGDPVSVSERSDPGALVVAPIFSLERPQRDEYVRVTTDALRSVGDVSRNGSGQATLAMVASGEIDAAVSTVKLSPWDTVAGVHLIRRAGGTVTGLDGDEWRHDSEGFVASNGACHDRVLSVGRG